jgi:ribosomal protein S18 acetylase RimI-like enzyme
MIREVDLQNRKLVEDLVNLQQESYQIEAQLIDFYDLPPLKDTIETLQHSDEIFYGYYIEATLAGAISYTLSEDIVDISRVVVKPAYFKRGIARSLLQEILTLHPHVKKILVSTAQKNIPAINLYKQFGFHITKEIIISPKLTLVNMQKDMQHIDSM